MNEVEVYFQLYGKLLFEVDFYKNRSIDKLLQICGLQWAYDLDQQILDDLTEEIIE